MRKFVPDKDTVSNIVFSIKKGRNLLKESALIYMQLFFL